MTNPNEIMTHYQMPKRMLVSLKQRIRSLKDEYKHPIWISDVTWNVRIGVSVDTMYVRNEHVGIKRVWYELENHCIRTYR